MYFLNKYMYIRRISLFLSVSWDSQLQQQENAKVVRWKWTDPMKHVIVLAFAREIIIMRDKLGVRE